jgi:hypothetical protein
MQIPAPDDRATEALLNEPVVLTEAELALINARARLELMQVVFAQLLMSFVVALLAWLIGGLDAGWSAVSGSADGYVFFGGFYFL